MTCLVVMVVNNNEVSRRIYAGMYKNSTKPQYIFRHSELRFIFLAIIYSEWIGRKKLQK